MSLLSLIREASVKSNLEKAGTAWIHITEMIKGSAEAGWTSVSITTGLWPDAEVECCITMLKLEGFYASWINEGHRGIEVDWMPRYR